MRLASIAYQDAPRLAVQKTSGKLVLAPSTMRGIDDLFSSSITLKALKTTLGDTQRATEIDVRQAQYLPAIRRPGKIVCIGLNYNDHTAESGYEQPDYPTVFTRFASSLCAHGGPLDKPAHSDSFDYEGELAVVIGKTGRNIARAEALDHVFGYSVFNDGSVREYQFKSPQWTVGKNFDATGAFGPLVVTADELPTGARGLKIETRLNGRTVQSASTSDMIFGVEDLICILSEVMTLEPGDVIVAGTPSGIGWARDPKLLMRHGDVCEVEIEGVGLLRNTVRDIGAKRRSAA